MSAEKARGRETTGVREAPLVVLRYGGTEVGGNNNNYKGVCQLAMRRAAVQRRGGTGRQERASEEPKPKAVASPIPDPF